MGAETKIDDIINLASRRQQRRNTEVLDFIKAGIKSYLKEGPFAQFPFWFLNIEPGYKFEQANLPLTQDDLDTATPVNIAGYGSVDYWLDRGLLRTNSGQSVYQLFAPAASPEGDQDGSFWVPTGYQRTLWVKPFALNGVVGSELSIENQQETITNSFTYKETMPCRAYVEKSRTGAFIRFVPTPDKAYMFKIAWVTDTPLDYYLDPADVADENWTNRIMQEYEELYIAVAQLKIAEYFGDLPNIQFYNDKIDGPENPNSIMQKLKSTHRMRKRTKTSAIPTWHNNPMTSGGARDPWKRRAYGRWR